MKLSSAVWYSAAYKVAELGDGLAATILVVKASTAAAVLILCAAMDTLNWATPVASKGV